MFYITHSVVNVWCLYFRFQAANNDEKIVRCDQVDPSWISIYRPANSPGCIFDMSSYKIDDNDIDDDGDDDDDDDDIYLLSSVATRNQWFFHSSLLYHIWPVTIGALSIFLHAMMALSLQTIKSRQSVLFCYWSL